MKKQEKQITVFDGEQYDREFPSYESTLPEVIEWLQDKLEKIPEEYRGAARCEISSESGYEGSSHATIKISYWRMETDEECQRREQQESAAAQSRLATERATYERLKAKFGG